MYDCVASLVRMTSYMFSSNLIVIIIIIVVVLNLTYCRCCCGGVGGMIRHTRVVLVGGRQCLLSIPFDRLKQFLLFAVY